MLAVPAPLAVSIALPFVPPSVGSHSSPPPLSTVTLPQLRMLFQSTHEDCQGAEAPAEPGERIAKSPLQRTLTRKLRQWAAVPPVKQRRIASVSTGPVGRHFEIPTELHGASVDLG